MFALPRARVKIQQIIIVLLKISPVCHEHRVQDWIPSLGKNKVELEKIKGRATSNGMVSTAGMTIWATRSLGMGKWGKNKGRRRNIIEICKKMKVTEKVKRKPLVTDSFKPRAKGHQ